MTRDIGKLAHQKGVKPLTWKIYNIAGWLLFEVIGILVGLIIFGKDNLFSVILVGFAFAVTSYFIIKSILNKLPDYSDDDINNIGNS